MTTEPDIAEYYRLGYGLDDIAAIKGMNPKTVKRHLLSQGVPLRPPNNVKRSKWLTEKATQGGQTWQT